MGKGILPIRVQCPACSYEHKMDMKGRCLKWGAWEARVVETESNSEPQGKWGLYLSPRSSPEEARLLGEGVSAVSRLKR